MNVSDFRKNLKECFDRAANGEVIHIERGGLVFYLASQYGAKEGEQRVVNAAVNMGIEIEKYKKNSPGATPQPDLLETIQPRIKNGDTPFRTEEEWKEAEATERPCCKASKPCQHWAFNPDTSVWKNTLSGRQREVEL